MGLLPHIGESSSPVSAPSSGNDTGVNENIPKPSAIKRFLNGLQRLCRCIPILRCFMSAGVSTHTPDTDIRCRNVQTSDEATSTSKKEIFTAPVAEKKHEAPAKEEKYGALEEDMFKAPVAEKRHEAPAKEEKYEVKPEEQTHIDARSLMTWINSLRESTDIKKVQFSEETLKHLNRVSWADVERVETATGNVFNIDGARYRAVLEVTRDGRKFVSTSGFVPQEKVDKAIVGDVKVKKKPDIL